MKQPLPRRSESDRLSFWEELSKVSPLEVNEWKQVRNNPRRAIAEFKWRDLVFRKEGAGQIAVILEVVVLKPTEILEKPCDSCHSPIFIP